MILYHGSNVRIDRIDLSKSRPFKDFGKELVNRSLFSRVGTFQKNAFYENSSLREVLRFNMHSVPN